MVGFGEKGPLRALLVIGLIQDYANRNLIYSSPSKIHFFVQKDTREDGEKLNELKNQYKDPDPLIDPAKANQAVNLSKCHKNNDSYYPLQKTSCLLPGNFIYNLFECTGFFSNQTFQN